MKSMTGFGSGHGSNRKIDLSIQIRAVNGRYFDFRPHMPSLYHGIERELKNAVQSFVQRGTVDIYVQRKVVDENANIQINQSAARDWAKAYQTLSKTLKVENDIKASDLGGLSGVLVATSESKVSGEEKKLVLSVLNKALKELEKERVREGRALKTELGRIITALQAQLKQVAKVSKLKQQEIKQRYQERLQALVKDSALDEQRVAQEVAILLDKSDTQEEMARLEEHLGSFKKLIVSASSQGKKMDFYCQEILREFNTIGSKSQNAKLTQVVVNAKSDIEKLREQVQNVE